MESPESLMPVLEPDMWPWPRDEVRRREQVDV